jgi:hypothetical protein
LINKARSALVAKNSIYNCNAGSQVVAGYGVGLKVNADCYNVVLADNIVDTTVDDGIFFRTSGAGKISGGTIKNAATYGMQVSVAADTTVSDVTILNPGLSGVYVTASDRTIVRGVKVQGGPVSGTYAGIHIAGITGVLVEGCVVRGHRYGLILAASTNEWNVTGNTFLGNAASDVFLSGSVGTSGVIRNNLYLTASGAPHFANAANISSATTLSWAQDLVHCNATSAAFTVTLPAAASYLGKVYTVRKIDASGNAVTIDGNGAETIDGAATQSLSSQWQYLTIRSDGVAWYSF